jgi:hypothetical protein
MASPMSASPGGHQDENGPQTLSVASQRVFHPRRHLRVNLSMNDLVALEFSKALGEHFLGRSGKPFLQLSKTLGAVLQVIQDQRLPFAADNFSGHPNRAGGIFHLGLSSDTGLQKGAYWRKRDFSLLSSHRPHIADAAKRDTTNLPFWNSNGAPRDEEERS